MNLTIAAYNLARYIQQVQTANMPTVEVVVQKVSGNIVFLTTAPSETPDAYFGGELIWQQGTPYELRTAILESAGIQIITTGFFGSANQPQPGDTLQLSGGPLATANVFLWEPESVDTTTDTAQYFVTVNAVSKRLKARTLGKIIKGWFNRAREFTFEVVVEVPMLTGATSTATRSALYDLMVMADQVEVLVADFTMQEANRVYSCSDIDTTFAEIMRTGSVWRRCAVLEFSLEQM